MPQYPRPLDQVWRLQQRGVPRDLHPVVDGQDCYVFQRKDPNRPRGFDTHIVPVDKFWACGGICLSPSPC